MDVDFFHELLSESWSSQTNGRLITPPLKSAYVTSHLMSLPGVPASAVEEKLEELLE